MSQAPRGATLLQAALAWRRTPARNGRLTSHTERYWIAAAISWLPLPLGRVMRLFGSDKQQEGQHAYGQTYHELFRRFRHRRIKLLEIGVLSGASLLGWRAFLSRATVVGADIAPIGHLGYRGLRTRQTDQSSPEALAALAADEGPFDVIIDDGSHINAHQILTFYTMFPHLNDDGIYVIEDAQTSFWPGPYGGAHPTDPGFADTCIGEMLELSKYVNHTEFLEQAQGLDARRLQVARSIRRIAFEHNLVVIWKAPNVLASNKDTLVSGGKSLVTGT